MRRSRTLLFSIAAVASAGLLAHLAASAAGFVLSPTTSSTSTTSTSGVTTTAAVSSDELNTALLALAAGGKTLGGPGTFLAATDGTLRIYSVLTGGGLNICVTLRNLSSGQIRVSANEAMAIDVEAGETRTSCYTMPSVIDLRCRQGTICQGVWRVDRQA